MKTFVTVVQHGSYTAAAEILGISSTMVAKHINRLESNLTIKLLNRTTRKQNLTEPGDLYYRHCIEILEKIQSTLSEIQEFNAKPAGTLKITAPITFGSEYLASYIHEFMQKHPNVKINLVLSDFVVDLIEGKYDAALRIGDIPDSGMIARPLKPYRLIVCAAPLYLSIHGEPKTPLDLEKHNCLLFNYHSPLRHWVFSHQDAYVHVKLNSNLKINNGPALKNAALNGAGIIIQPEILVMNELKNGSLIELLKEFPLPIRPLHLIYMHDPKMPLRLREFIKFCIAKWGINP